MSEAAPSKGFFYLGVAISQIIAFTAAFGGTMTELIGDNAHPMFMATCTYALLIIVHGSYLVSRHGWRLPSAWRRYAVLGLIDVTAAYFTILSLKYTTVTSWAMLQPSSLLAAVPLSICLLKASYTWKHLLSGLTAVLGLVLLLLLDFHEDDEDSDHGGGTKLWGDLCAWLGASLYGVNTVLVETVIKGDVPSYEVLSMIGCFGFGYGAAASLVLGEVTAHMFPRTVEVAYTVAAIFSNFAFYALGIAVLHHAGTAVLEIGLLASNLWSALGKVFIVGGFHTNPVGFGVALVILVSGVTLFSLSGDPYAAKAYARLETEMTPSL